jgi:asparagine N-glycosylation enzyme membrane subunit Stt3
LNACTASLATVLLIAAAMNLVFANTFTAVCMAGVGAYLFAQTLVWRTAPRLRLLVWVLAIAAGIAGAHFGAPGLEERLLSTLRVALHLLRASDVIERFYAYVDETSPIAWTQLYTNFSLLVWISPVLVILLARQAWKERDFTKAAIGVMFVCLLFASVRNQRFANMAAAAMAPLVGWTLSGFAGVCVRRLSRGGQTKRAGVVVKGAITILMLVGFEPYVAFNASLRAQHSPYIPPAMQEAFQWLKAHTPECPGLWNPTSQPPYRVMAVWDYGWWILDQAQRVPVANNAGEGAMAAMEFFFGASPAEAEEIATQQNARYVLTAPTTGKASVAFRILRRLPEPVLSEASEPDNEAIITHSYLSSVHGQLQVYDGSAHTGDGVELAALGHYRLMFEAAEQSDTPIGSQPSVKIFERVPGARVEGKASPGAAITASIDLESGAGRRFMYSDTSTADARGKFTLTLPYPTDASSGDTKPLGKWKLTVAGQERELDVASETMLEGKVISL